MAQTMITAGDSLGSTALTAGNDGTLALVTGPAGSKVTALSIDATGTSTFIKQPVLPVHPMVRLNTANGYGSTNNKIRRFTNTTVSQGTDITYADSATLGGSFTINTSGVYGISYSDQTNNTSPMGLSLNTTQPTTSINSLPVLEIIAATINGFPNNAGCTSATIYLPAGSVVRAQTDGTASGTNPNICQFIIVRIA